MTTLYSLQWYPALNELGVDLYSDTAVCIDDRSYVPRSKVLLRSL